MQVGICCQLLGVISSLSAVFSRFERVERLVGPQMDQSSTVTLF